MRILQITHQYPPHHIGGVELLTQQLSRDLAQRGHSVHVLTRASANHGTSDEDGITLHRLPEAPSPTQRFLATFYDNATLRACERILDAVRPEVVHIQHLMGYPTALTAAIRSRNIPYLVSLHDYWFACANANLITNFDEHICSGPHGIACGRCAAARAAPSVSTPLNVVIGAALTPALTYRNAQLRPVLHHARAVIANSTFVARWLQQQMPGQPSVLVEYGLDFPMHMPIQRQPRPSQALRCATIGSLAHTKGLHVLIDAFNQMSVEDQLTIAGSPNAFPDYAAQLQHAATHLGISFAGALSRPAVWRLLAHTDVVVVPSLWHETASLIAREALASGCYVIASDTGALTELIQAHPTRGALVPPNDVTALRQALMRAKNILQRNSLSPLSWRSTQDYAADIEQFLLT